MIIASGALMSSQMTNNQEIAQLLRCVAAAHIIKGANRFRILAYENAADTVEHINRELKDIWREGKLDKVPGIGSIIGSALDELFRIGHSKHFDEMLKGIPDTVCELMRVSGLGPKKAFKLVKLLHLSTKETVVDDLRNLAAMGKIAPLEGFGKKSEEKILKNLDRYKNQKHDDKRMPLPYAHELAQSIVKYMKKLPSVKRVEAMGSLRRMVATIGDIDLVVQANRDYANIIKHFVSYPGKISLDNSGEKKASIIITPNIRVDLRIQDEEGYGSMLQYFTGSKAHNIRLREYAQRRGLSLSEYGIKELKTKNLKLRTFKDEESFYKFLGLAYIPPEIREDSVEIELAKKNQLPKLIEVVDIKGDFHIHSSYDLKPSHDLGRNSYQELIQRAKELNYKYMGFSDHNPKISGHNEAQIVEILRKRKESMERSLEGIKYFIGLEVDILPDGTLPLSLAAIDHIDYMIVSVHSAFDQDIQTMTKRVLRGLSHPKVKIFGHPTGRKLHKREGVELDWEKIFTECKKRDIALEINSWPERLDLPDTLIREAMKFKCKFVIDTDSHAVSHMDNMFYGVSVARRGWLTKGDIYNTLEYNKFKEWLML